MLAGITAISFAAVLIKSCQAPPLAIALYRLGFASLLLLPVFTAKKGFRHLRRADVLWAALSGLFLSLHFILWIYSLTIVLHFL